MRAWLAPRQHDLTLGQMAVAHQPSAAMFGALVGVAVEEGDDLCFDGLG